MNTLERNTNSIAWREIGESLPRPRTILAISAHWLTAGVAATAMNWPETLHDFAGFPPRLFAFSYPAPGDPELARRVAEVLAPTPVSLDQDWGLDHGAWSVLAHLFPAADIPVVQLSLDVGRSAAEHRALAARLAPLRDEGVLILGSGNTVHNLRRMDWRGPDMAFDWAERFDARVRRALTVADADVLVSLVSEGDADARLAVPTPEHYLPLLYIATLARPGETVQLFNERIEYGAIGMLGCRIG